MELVLYFFLYSFLGWICECIYCGIPAHRFINRGFLAGPYCPIYGVGALFVLHLLQPFGKHVTLVFLMGCILTSILEYITGWGMEILFHTKWWDYSKEPFNINGRVCLKNSILFGILSIFVYYIVHPLLSSLIQEFSPIAQGVLCVVLLVYFIYDLINTTHALLRRNKDFKEIEDSIKELRAEFKVANIFPLQESLSDTFERILDSTDADEILLSHIQQLKVRIIEMKEKRKNVLTRLQKAFPNRLEPRSDVFEHIVQSIEKHKKQK